MSVTLIKSQIFFLFLLISLHQVLRRQFLLKNQYQEVRAMVAYLKRQIKSLQVMMSPPGGVLILALMTLKESLLLMDM